MAIGFLAFGAAYIYGALTLSEAALIIAGRAALGFVAGVWITLLVVFVIAAVKEVRACYLTARSGWRGPVEHLLGDLRFFYRYSIMMLPFLPFILHARWLARRRLEQAHPEWAARPRKQG